MKLSLMIISALFMGMGLGYALRSILSEGGEASQVVLGSVLSDQGQGLAATSGASLEQALRKTQLRLAEVEARNSHLEAEIEQAQLSMIETAVQDAADQVGKTEEELRAERAERALERHAVRLQNRVDSRMLALVSRLGLDIEQENALRVYLARENELHLRLRELRMSGQYDSPERGEIQRELASLVFDDYMQSILSAEQQSAYEAYSAESKQAEYEARAARELSQTTQFLAMTPEQKDRMFEVFYYQAEQDSGWNAAMDADGNIDPDAYIELRLQAVKTILNDEQLAVYKQHLELDRERFMRYYRRFH